jgi:hypothetical protein
LNADIDSYGFKSEDDLLKAVSMIELLKGWYDVKWERITVYEV